MHKRRSSAGALWIAAVLCAAMSQEALSQTAASPYPSRPLRIISIFTPGSVADGAIRLVAQKMSASMDQPVVVEVQAGAGGILGGQTLVRSAPDGYTILHTTPASLVSTPYVLKNRPYDPLKDFTYITHLMDAGTCLLVAAALPVTSVKELIEYARARPGALAYGSNGVGGAYHLEMELLKLKHGLEITHVPYKGGQDGLNAAAAGQIPIAFAPAMSALAQARAGKVKVLAVLHRNRLPGVPDVPSMGEQLPDYEKIPGGDEIVGPAGMPGAILKRLHGEIIKALNTPEVQERLAKIGFIPVGNTPEEHAAQMRSAVDVFARGRKAARIEVEQ
jgi:tripartite-type tricarboxylate transporter receptor subunit TctC